MEWLNTPGMAVVKSYLVFLGVGILLFTLTARFYLRHARNFSKEYPTLSEREFHWLIWPAIGANRVFEWIFGRREVRICLRADSFEKLNAAAGITIKTPSRFETFRQRLFNRKAKTARLHQDIQKLQERRAMVSDRLQELQNERVLETRIEEKQRLGPILAKLQKEREQLDIQLDELEAQLPPDAQPDIDSLDEKDRLAAVIAQLRDLQDIEYANEATFLSAVAAKIGRMQAEHYNALILKHAENRSRIRDLFTWRSISATLGISLLANSLCVIMILLSVPEDVPPFELPLLKILGLSYVMFIVFNFLGDAVSVNFTRHVLSTIAAGRCNLLRYLAIDLSGIVFGYVVTLLPPLVVTGYCWFSDAHLNEWIQIGLLGNALIPFFLLIFATTNMPPLFTLFAVLAVFSITIPTLMYIALMFFCYCGFRFYKLYQRLWKDKSSGIKAESVFNLAKHIAIILILLALCLEAAGMLSGK